MFQPVLFPLLVLNEAFHVAPPVAMLSWMFRYCALTTPDTLESVNCEPGVALLMVTKLPDVPDSPKFATVCVDPAVNLTVAGCTLLVMLLKVLEPSMVNAPAPAWFML